MSQLKLPGLEKIEAVWEAQRRVAEKKAHEDWAAGILENMVEREPPSSEECELMMSGIRLSRFVSHLECEKCSLATHDHSLGFLYWYYDPRWRQDIPILFCLKDFYRKFPRMARAMSKYV